MCEYAVMQGSKWICPEGKARSATAKKEVWCHDFSQQALCGQEANKAISDYFIHRRSASSQTINMPKVGGATMAHLQGAHGN
jgi:hypothetical protein